MLNMNNTERMQQMRQRLELALKPTRLEIIDDSYQHIGHPGASTGLGYFTVIISSSQLQNLSRLQQHRLVYDALGEMMSTDIHAIKIQIVA